MIEFHVPCVPVPQPRQRHRVVMAKGKMFATNYTPRNSTVNVFKVAVQTAAADVYQGAPLEGPICVEVVFVMPRPKRLIWKSKPMPQVPHGQKPDLDNLVKTLDALTGLIWRDDAQIAHINARKVFAAGDEQPHVEVRIGRI